MKLPKLPHQWERLNELEKQRIEEANELCIAFLVRAGYHGDSRDENGEDITDGVQTLLVDAVLRAPQLYLMIDEIMSNERAHELNTRQPATKLVYVVEEQGATFAFEDKLLARIAYSREQAGGAIDLMWREAQAPIELTGDELAEWCASN